MFETELIRNIKPYIPSVHQHLFQNPHTTDFLKLDWNESTLPPSPHVIEKLVEFVLSGKLYLYPEPSNQELIDKLSVYCQVNRENLQIFAGADAVLECAAKTFLAKGDTLLLTTPTYDNMRAAAQLSGVNIERFVYEEQTDFQPDLFMLQDQIRLLKPKMVYICNPNNPTATCFPVQDLYDLISRFPHSLFLIDEAYYEFNHHLTAAPLVKEFSNLLIVRTFSKAFALAGLRIGYGIGSKTLIQALNKVRNVKSICSLGQIAAAACLEDLPYMRNYVQKVNQSKLVIHAHLPKLSDFVFKYYMQGNFVLMKVDNKERMLNWLASHRIFVRDLKHLEGLEKYIRITLGTEEQTQKVLDCIQSLYTAAGERTCHSLNQ